MVHMTYRLYNIYCIDVHSHNILLITLFMGLCNNYKKYFLPVYIPSLVGILHLNFSSLKKKSQIFFLTEYPTFWIWVMMPFSIFLCSSYSMKISCYICAHAYFDLDLLF